MKGIGPLIVALVIGGLSLYSFVLAFLVGKTITSYQSQVEREILAAINKMEFLKREIPVAIRYSFYQASYDLSNRGGYENYATSYNCIPYWEVFSQDNTPDINSNLQNTFLKIFSKYTSTLSDYTVSFPDFQITIDRGSGKLNVFSADSIVVSNPNFYTIRENAAFTETVDTRIFVMFDLGKDFSNQVSQAISSSSSYSDAIQKIAEAQTSFNANNAGQFNVNVQIDNNAGKDESNFAFRSLVTITDISDHKYPVYDFTQSKNDYQNLKLNFYVFGGKDATAQPLTNECQKINY